LDRLTLPRPIHASTYDGYARAIREVAVLNSLDIAGSRSTGRVFLYIVLRINRDHGIILGRPWRQQEDAYIDPKTDTLYIRRIGVSLQNLETLGKPDIRSITAVSYHYLSSNRNRNPETSVFAISLADIRRALTTKKYSDPRTKLPQRY
jgi:hypothetical protein